MQALTFFVMNKQEQLFFENPECFANKEVELYFMFCFREAAESSGNREVVLDASSAANRFPNTLQQVYKKFPRFLSKLQKLDLDDNYFCAMKQTIVERDDPRIKIESYVMGYFGELVPKKCIGSE